MLSNANVKECRDGPKVTFWGRSWSRRFWNRFPGAEEAVQIWVCKQSWGPKGGCSDISSQNLHFFILGCLKLEKHVESAQKDVYVKGGNGCLVLLDFWIFDKLWFGSCQFKRKAKIIVKTLYLLHWFGHCYILIWILGDTPQLLHTYRALAIGFKWCVDR